jgi:hypothetical protein
LLLEIPRLWAGEAETLVWLIQFTLKFEQCGCEFPEGFIGPCGFSIPSGSDEAPEIAGEFGKIGDGLHAVFILPGWFTATAWNRYLTE